MPRYVAFLRAINVGGHTVRMDQLRALFTGMGFSDVETFIASGNVIFCTKASDIPALERKIEGKLASALGYRVAVFIRSIAEIHEIANYQPFPADSDGTTKTTVYVVLLGNALTASARKAVLAFNTEDDMLAVKGKEIYWRRRGNLLDSPLSGARIERSSAPGTMRNRNTIVRLAAKYKE
jgi:uncharacterized protein (DUF1697 family)